MRPKNDLEAFDFIGGETAIPVVQAPDALHADSSGFTGERVTVHAVCARGNDATQAGGVVYVQQANGGRYSGLAVTGLDSTFAEGDEVKSGRAVRMYQLILADGLTYYIAQGFVAADRPADVMDLFRKVTGSFRKVQTGR